MARVKAASFLYALALLALPFSAGVKQMLELLGTTWVNPTLILGVLVFLLLRVPLSDRYAFRLGCFAFLSALVGSLFLGASAEREHSATYTYYVEPIRLCLNLTWYWASIQFLLRKRDFVLRWLSVSVVFQLLVGLYGYLALFDLVPVPEILGPYLAIYKDRQAVWFGDTPIYRMAGTFIEGPPFGLFMFSCFVIFVLSWVSFGNAQNTRLRRWIVIGALASFVGAVASLSDSVLLAILAFLVPLYLAARAGFLATHAMGKVAETVLVTIALLAIGIFTGHRVKEKWDEALAPPPLTNDVIGESGAERMFHIRYGLGRFAEEPLAALSGIGPGRYGDYAVRTGLYPATVQIAVMPIEWLVEYGLFGLTLIVAWLCNIGQRSRRVYGGIAIVALLALLLANTGQANWLWETWFLALAFLYSSTTDRQVEHRAHVGYST